MADLPDIEFKRCEQCGASFPKITKVGRPQKYCSPQCRYTSKDRRRGRSERCLQVGPCLVESCEEQARVRGLCSRHYQRSRAGKPNFIECQHCGKTTERTKYCSLECCVAARKARLGVKPRAERRPAHVERQCVVCSAPFKRRTEGRDAGLCCSRQCGFVYVTWRGERMRKVSQAKAEFRRWARRNKAITNKKIEKQRLKIALAQRPCKICGLPIGYKRTITRKSDYCSKRCYMQTAESKQLRRSTRLRRKMKKRVQTIETVNPIRVFERDGWICHLCGGMTIKDKRGTYHPKAPELDHIIPISKGGPHSYANTACAHRACNAAKGDSIVGQASLLAA